MITDKINLDNTKPDILVCSETRNLVCPNYFNIHGYVIHYNNSTINICDGVVVYVKSNLRHNASTESIGQAKFLNIIIELDNNIELKISSIYRCFGHDKSNFINSIKQLLIKNVNVQNHIIIGDFNIDLLKPDSESEVFMSNYLEHEYLPNFVTVTRPNNNGGGSCIDNMFAKTNFKCKAHKIIQKITDHYTLLLHIDLNSLDKIDNKKKSFSINYKKLINLCSKEDFNLLVNSNIDDSLDQFINKVQELIKLSLNKTKVNKKDKKKSRAHKEWITPALIKSCNTKSNLYKIWQNNPHNIALKENYMKFSNKLHNLIKYTKLKFEKKQNK